jgi:hypothetical protein
MGPAGVCDACGRFCLALHQANGDTRCYDCGNGDFIQRGQWDFYPCSVCNDESDGRGCNRCNGTGLRLGGESLNPHSLRTSKRAEAG